MLQINDANIDWVEKLLLPAGCTFNDERRTFIRCMESRDVVACPGSGKTTALLAKLLILASYMPFSDGRGICVLTHTNVAIDEIKMRTGGAAGVLFTHPNYFGTIQGFVNRFFAMPFYRIKFGQAVRVIDNGLFDAAIEWYYKRDDRDSKGLRAWIELNKGNVKTLGNYWLKSTDLLVGKDLENDIKGLRRGTETYKTIESIRQKILRQGVLSFNDAYSLGLHYLYHYPNVVKAIQHRFKFVFIDEMQDTDNHQLRVLDKLFSGCNELILQRLGDPNQAIYQSKVKQKMLWSPSEPPLPFSNSMRYGATIAKVLNTVRVDRSLTLEPNKNRQSLKPHILLFDTGNERSVLPAFGTLIRDHGLHELESPIFRAVAWVGKDKTDGGKVSIQQYYQEYQKNVKISSRWFGTVLSYAQAIDMSLREDPCNVKKLVEIMLASVVRALIIAGHKNPRTQRPVTTGTFRNYITELDDGLEMVFNFILAESFLSLRQGSVSVEQLRDTISTFFRGHFVSNETEELRKFLDSNDIDITPPEKGRSNTFVSANGDKIGVGTVHSVKGETHTATLYLETFFHALDSQRLLPFCLGLYPTADSKKSRHIDNLKIAHVAFSRPTHLLVFACCNEHVTGREAELENAGWIIRKIGDKMSK